MAGFQNNPLTKFPLSVTPPGSANRASPNGASRGGQGMQGLAYSPIGPIGHATHVALTPTSGRNLGRVNTQVTTALKPR